MCYKILNDKNTHLIAWNEILTQFGECDALPNPVCAVAEPVAHAENWPGLPCAPSFINSHTNSTTIRYFFFTRGKLGVPPRWSYYGKINFARHQHDTKRTQNRVGCSHRQLFLAFWGSSVWRNNQRKLWRKISLHSDVNRNLELSTPTESRHTTCLLGGKSPSVKLMSRRENKELAKTNLKNMDRTMQELQHIGSIKDLRPQNT